MAQSRTEVPFKTWPYEDQTKTKHKVFADYIDKWIKVVGKDNKLNYIDGFGGIGAYKDDRGSLFFGYPVLAAEAVQKMTNKLQRTVNIIVIDNDQTNLDNIQEIFNHRRISIKPILINASFDMAINDILDNVQNLAPTFVFIDPFGFSIKMSTIKRVMGIDKSEVLLNFMFTRVNEFLGARQVENTINELFGSSGWQQFRKLTGAKREQKIVEFYRQQLKKFSKYVYYFRLEFPTKRRTYYYLFHLTNHFLGCEIMKSSFAKFNYGRVEYRGSRSGQMELFEAEDARKEGAVKFLQAVYRGNQKTFGEVVEEQIDETKFLVSQLRSAIKSMEKNNLVAISRIPQQTPKGKKRRGLGYKDIIVFQR